MGRDGEGFALKEHLGAEEAVLKQILKYKPVISQAFLGAREDF